MDREPQNFAHTRETLEEFVGSDLFPGASVLIAHQREVVFRHATGFARLDPPTEATTEHVWPIASITKPVSATALLQLVDKGAFSLDQPVVELLPDFGPGKEKVLVRHLLTHSSGMKDEWPTPEASEQVGPVAALGKIPLAYEPGTGVTYCTAAFEVVKALVVKYSGQSWSAYMRDQIFDPLNMNDTGFQLSPEGVSRVALAYDLDGTPNNWANDPQIQRWELAGGGLFSTLDDLAAFGSSFLKPGAGLLKPETYEAMTSLQTAGLNDISSGSLVTWGLGWYLNRDGRVGGYGHFMSERAFGHGGATGTRLAIDPANELVLVFLGNRIGMEVDQSNKWETAVTDAAMRDLGLA